MENVVYLITGAAGFLGSNICAQLLERGNRVRAFVLEGDKTAKYIPKDVEIVYGDLCNKQSLEKFFKVEEGTETICIHYFRFCCFINSAMPFDAPICMC